MVATKRKKKPLTLEQIERKELANLTKENNQKRLSIKEKFKVKRSLGNISILSYSYIGKIHLILQNSGSFYTYENQLRPTKEMLKKLLEIFPPINLYHCRNKGNKAFYYEGSKKLETKEVELIYPILVQTNPGDSNTCIKWETKTHQITIKFPGHKANRLTNLVGKSSYDHGMESINYQDGYITRFWPYQSEFDITEYIDV